ncbi:hypothetical protein, partial [Bifidobacterium breve]|uniref:hypothetical protein n=1 Tax=Bifidobacterium breve TaxID=1685 RepID=UPI0022AFF7B1
FFFKQKTANGIPQFSGGFGWGSQMAGRDLWSGLVLDCVPHQGENGCFEPSVAQFVPQNEM